MFGNGKNGEERINNKTTKKKKEKKAPKYGLGKLRHSRMGIYSCELAGGSFVLFAAAVFIAYWMRGETAAYIGGMGIVALALAAAGFRMAVKGFRERERHYITCKIGAAVNLILFIGLLIIFLGGLF